MMGKSLKLSWMLTVKAYLHKPRGHNTVQRKAAMEWMQEPPRICLLICSSYQSGAITNHEMLDHYLEKTHERLETPDIVLKVSENERGYQTMRRKS